MSFLDIFRRFFVGSSDSAPNQSDFRNDFRNPIWENNDEDSDNDFRHTERFSFNIYTDPLEIHRYFEQQMNEMMKSFRMMEPFQDLASFFDGGFEEFHGLESPHGFDHPPAIEAPPMDSQRSLREQILKPEYRRIESPSDKVDEVLDGQLDANDIGRALDSKGSSVLLRDQDMSLIPREDSFFSNSREAFSFTGRTMMSTMVRRSDGTIEREEIVKEADGTERKTVTRRSGDHEYSVTTITDASGVEKRTENFQSIESDQLDDFDKTWEGPGSKWRNWWDSRNPFF